MDPTEILNALKSKKQKNIPFTLDEIMQFVGNTSDNRVLVDWLVKNGTCTAAEFKEAQKKQRRRERLRKELGFEPTTCLDFIEKLAEKHKVTLRLTGEIKQDAMILVDDVYVTAEDRQVAIIDKRARLMESRTINIEDFSRQARMVRDDFGLPFGDGQIGDAIKQWEKNVSAKTRDAMMMDISFERGRSSGPEGIAMWEKMEKAAFKIADHPDDVDWDQGIMPVGFPSAIIRKFIWQVKRKAFNYEITNHLMPVITGTSGGGKSSFVHQLCSPIKDGLKMVDFNMVSDDRIIDIWDAIVLFMDEMSGANKADISITKSAITATTLTRRPMRSNNTVKIRQHATMIGCADKGLAELIKDAAGMRRFAELHFKNKADWTTLNEIDWKILWKSVDEDAADPSECVFEQLMDQQVNNRERHPIEIWSDENGKKYRSPTKASIVYDDFLEWEREKFQIMTTFNAFSRRMNTLMSTSKDFGWSSKRTIKFMTYQYVKFIG